MLAMVHRPDARLHRACVDARAFAVQEFDEEAVIEAAIDAGCEGDVQVCTRDALGTHKLSAD